MSDPAPESIRSYGRIFRPERRIYQVEGHALPVPGGVPLRWLAWAALGLIASILLSSGSVLAPGFPALAAAAAGFSLGGKESAFLAGLGALLAAWAIGFGLGLLDWPLRLLVVPGALATLATQRAPDGRRAERFAASWLALRLAPRRRSLGRRCPPTGTALGTAAELWVAPDERSAKLGRGRVRGPARLAFAGPVRVGRSALGRRKVARPAGEGRPARLLLGEGEVLEVRP